jgi:cytochrome c oxidase assembly protein subunit 15
MAVPDWPSTYGYNLFLYPWSTWLTGPWDLFIEHGHRLLGAAVGLIAVGLVVATLRFESRRWVRRAAAAALLLVVAQGCLGGLRVLLDSSSVAQIHGIVGPLFFAYAVAMACVTSDWWRRTSELPSIPDSIVSTAWFALALAAAQLGLGSQLRHVSGMSAADVYGLFVWMHVLVGLCLLGLAPGLAVAVWRLGPPGHLIRRPAVLLASCVWLQVLLGVLTWITRFGLPAFACDWFSDWTYTVHAESMLSSLLATGHVANGSLILALATMIAIRSRRCAAVRSPIVSSQPSRPMSLGAVR